MEELKLGIVKSKELAEWFQISASTYYNQKSKKLKELEQYCKFEDLGKKGVNILEIYNAYYQTKARQKVKQIFDELFKEGELVEWGQDDNSIDTATHFANKVLKKYGLIKRLDYFFLLLLLTTIIFSFPSVIPHFS